MRPAPFVACTPFEIGHGRATSQCERWRSTEDQRGDETEHDRAEQDSPVETDVGKCHGYGEQETQRQQQQAAVAREMSSNMQAMTTAVEDISRNVSLIANSSRELDDSTRQVREASRKMAS